MFLRLEAGRNLCWLLFCLAWYGYYLYLNVYFLKLVTNCSVACREECYTHCMLWKVMLNKCESLLSPIFLIFAFVSVPLWLATALSSFSFISDTYFWSLWEFCSRSRSSRVIICGGLKGREQSIVRKKVQTWKHGRLLTESHWREAHVLFCVLWIDQWRISAVWIYHFGRDV